MASKKINGKGLRLSFTPGGANAAALLISNETNISLELTKDSIDVTDKEDDAWGDFLAGRKSGTCSCDAFVNFAPEAGRINVAGMFTHFSEDTEQDGSFTLTGPAQGDIEIDFLAIITGLTITGGNNEGATFSFTLQVRKKPTLGVKA